MSNNSVICIKSDNVNCEETSNTVNNVSLIDEELVTENNIVNCETVNTVNNVPMDKVLTDNDIVNCEMRNTVNNATSNISTEDVLTEDNIVNCETVNTVNNVPMDEDEVLTENDTGMCINNKKRYCTDEEH